MTNMSTPPHRNILHVDMDAFYASVEQRDEPALRGKPVLVGGDPSGRGVVAAASYEARKFGCHSAMPTGQALRLCPQAIVVHPRMSVYIEVSRQIFAIFEQYSPLVEPLSIDEAFLDITGTERLLGSAEHVAAQIKQRIRDEIHLTASVGVAPNKFLAKLASDLEKPDGLTVVPADNVLEFLDPLPIERLWGVGPATRKLLKPLGITTFGDLRRIGLPELQQRFGQLGDHFYHLVRGEDTREVVPDHAARSISHEQTFATDVTDLDYLRDVLLAQTEDVARRLRRHEALARTATIKVRRHDFRTYTRSATLPAATDQTTKFWQAVRGLLDAWAAEGMPAVRLIGMGVSNLTSAGGQQLSLFDQKETERRRRLDQTIDQIRERFGRDAISHGRTKLRE